MNLTLSNKIRLMEQRRFYTDRDKNPCWYVEAQKSDKRRQFKWKVGVKYLGETEEYLFGVTGFDVNDDLIWNNIVSQSFAEQLLDVFKSGGKKAVKEWLKEENV